MKKSINFRILKLFQNYSDILVVTGFADLLRYFYENSSIILIEKSIYFEIHIETDSDFLLDSKDIAAGYYYIKRKGDEYSPKIDNSIDYEQQKEIVARQRKQEDYSKKITTEELLSLHPEYFNCRNLEMMRQGWTSDIKFIQYLDEHQEEVRSIIRAFHDFLKSDKYPEIFSFSSFDRKLNKIISNSQFFNPITGKGFSAYTTRIKSASSLPLKFRIGFFDWMKIRGFYKTGLTNYVHQSKIMKISILSPGEIALHQLEKVRLELMKKKFWGTIKSDILMLLFLSEILLTHSREYQSESSPKDDSVKLLINLGGRKLNEIITGISQATFINLGQAYAINNESFLNLPGWWNIRTAEDANDLLDVLREHRNVIILSFDESHSDDIELLQEYRSFISSGLYEDFLKFTTNFACLLLNKIERIPKRTSRFHIKNLDKLLMKMTGTEIDLAKIVENEGFQNISKAIRIATVKGQYRKAKNNQVWDIHYGLAQNWKKHCTSKTKIIQLVSEFIQKYNAETASKAEQGGYERRKAITTDDLDNLIRLMEINGSEIVIKLLLAYGFARDSKPKEKSTEETSR